MAIPRGPNTLNISPVSLLTQKVPTTSLHLQRRLELSDEMIEVSLKVSVAQIEMRKNLFQML